MSLFFISASIDAHDMGCHGVHIDGELEMLGRLCIHKYKTKEREPGSGRSKRDISG